MMMLLPDKNLLSGLQADPGWRAGNILDIRPAEAFADGHLQGAVSHPVDGPPPGDPASWLQEALPSIFLPPREEPLLVAGDQEDWLAEVAAHLAGRGRSGVSTLLLEGQWWRPLPEEAVALGPASGHLWHPPPFLERHVRLLPPPEAGPVLDLGCGSGRAAVWLAMRGYRVTGIDWQPEALELGERLAASQDVRCRFLKRDLRRPEARPPGPWAVILNFRFLIRPMLAGLAERLAPGGVAVVRTFRLLPNDQDRPRPRHHLKVGELAGYFPSPGCEVLVHEEDFDPDGRPAAGIVARRIT